MPLGTTGLSGLILIWVAALIVSLVQIYLTIAGVAAIAVTTSFLLWQLWIFVGPDCRSVRESMWRIGNRSVNTDRRPRQSLWSS